MCNDVGEGSRCCAFYSVTGFIFTVSLILFCFLRSGKTTSRIDRPLPLARPMMNGHGLRLCHQSMNIWFCYDDFLIHQRILQFSPFFATALGRSDATNSAFSDCRHWGHRGSTRQCIWSHGNVFGLLFAVGGRNLVWFAIQGGPNGGGARVGLSIERWWCAHVWNIKLDDETKKAINFYRDVYIAARMDLFLELRNAVSK